MKRMLLAALAMGTTLSALAQTDSTARTDSAVISTSADTIRVGGLVIVRNGKSDRNITWSSSRNNRRTPKNLSSNWFILDLGFSNYNDATNYGSAGAQAFAPGGTKEGFKLRTGKSVNVNLWIFMQKLNLAKHRLNLKYGIGLELNNYHFDDERVHFYEDPTVVRFDYDRVSKNKLAADYVTVPVMLNFDFTPGRRKGFGFSAGVSAGYLYSSRQKVKIAGKKDKTHDNFDLEPWKLSWIGELNLGPVRLYGSYAMNNMWSRGLDQKPYNVGIRLSHW
ncbi:outer membrane beta-barrel protein [Flaviaesturariibacter amylovorans]|uniref:Outer membrane protein beta-barrel domain-containing protein n=1 Tax=Flaviaesturariibacter amylovorans TaxID=1084520 RepID=A0ABP8G4R0_9BACT